MKQWVRRANGLPGRTVTADTYLAEEEKEATNEFQMVNLDPETGGPFHHAYDQAPGEQESRGSHEQPPRRRRGQRAAEHHAYDQAPREQESRGSHEQPPRRRRGQRVRKQLKRSQRLHSQGDVHEADSGFREGCSFDSSACSSRAGHPKREGRQQPFEDVCL